MDRYDLLVDGLERAAVHFNCEPVFLPMARKGIVNRGSDCDEVAGIFSLARSSRQVPYLWSLPHFYQATGRPASGAPVCSAAAR